MVQEVALRLWKLHRAGKQIEDPENYAMTALANLSRSRWRDQKPTTELQEDHLSHPSEAPGHLLCREVIAAIQRLPEDQAALMELVLMGEYSPQTLAHQLKIPVGTVNSRLARARAQLRQELDIDPECGILSLLD